MLQSLKHHEENTVAHGLALDRRRCGNIYCRSEADVDEEAWQNEPTITIVHIPENSRSSEGRRICAAHVVTQGLSQACVIVTGSAGRGHTFSF